MDIIFALISLCLIIEFFYTMNNWLGGHIKREYSNTTKLIAGIASLSGTIILITMLNTAPSYNAAGSLYFSGDRLILPTFDFALKPWAPMIIILVGFCESIFFIVIGTIGKFRGKGGRVTTRTVNTAAVKRVADLLKLSPNQTKAFAYIYEHKCITIDDFQLLCPEIDRSSLEQDLQALVRLGLAVNKEDKFIIT